MRAPQNSSPCEEEVDIWWGACAIRTITPSLVATLLLSAVIYFIVHALVRERGWLQLAFVGTAGVLWLVQMVRWCHRLFTWNYRLTTRYLYVDRGFRPLVARRYPLDTVAQVVLRRGRLDNWLGTNNIRVYFKDGTCSTAELQGLRGANHVAELIRDAVAKAAAKHNK
jgi:hypothetical protein